VNGAAFERGEAVCLVELLGRVVANVYRELEPGRMRLRQLKSVGEY
jgi:hypothetical protein